MKLESPSDSAQSIPSLFEAVTNKSPITQQPEPPHDLMRFRTLSKYEKEKAGSDFFRKEHIVKYLDEKWDRELSNKVGFEWLLELKDETTDSAELQKINMKLREFARVIKDTRNPYDALLVDVSRYV